MQFVLTRDPEEFADRAGTFVAERLDCNVMATVLLSARAGLAAPLFGCGYEADALGCAALRTPPHPLLVSELAPDWAQELLDAWLAEDPELSGVSAVPATAAAIAAAWCRRTGGTTTCRLHEAMHVLTEVSDPPRPAPGRLRVAQAGERDLLLAWTEAFERDAGVAVRGQAARMVDSRLPYGGMLLWDDGGPVSMAQRRRPVPHGITVSGVYTPPARRRHGYATACVAALSQLLLDEGHQFCTLFTDLANPTSNDIYQQIGYRPRGDFRVTAFEAIEDGPA